MKKIITFFILITLLFSIFPFISNANIDITVSPIKYELTIEKWQTDNKIVKIYNNTDFVQEIFVTTKNAISMQDNWQPNFVEEIENPELYLADWITPSITNFDINPWENMDIPFSITVPNNANPWWHYWAIFFNVKETNTWWQINIQKRIWVLVLLKIPWEVSAVWEIKDIKIAVTDWWWWAWSKNDKSNFIWKIFKKYVLWDKSDSTIELAKNDTKNSENEEDLDLSSADEKINNTVNWIENNTEKNSDKKSDFNVDLTIDFENKWNTHLKPTWKIEIVDEDWNTLKKIWKETIKNEAWAIIWEKVVDYIPINDENWNVLPNENRKFNQNWDWFAYETLDENWKKIIKYYDPSEYYSSKNTKENWYLMPWERVCTREINKKLTAKINLKYTDPDWKEVEFNSARDFNVSYNEEYIWLNWYVVLPLIIFWLLLILYFILWACKKRKCPKCKKKVWKDMQICPYCGEKLKHKKSSK